MTTYNRQQFTSEMTIAAKIKTLIIIIMLKYACYMYLSDKDITMILINSHTLIISHGNTSFELLVLHS